MKVLAVALALVAAGLAGCSDDDAQVPAGPAPVPGTDGTSVGNISLDPAAIDSPVWTVGQSWTWRLESVALEAPVQATTVVLEADGETYSVGVPTFEDGANLLPFHLAGLGAVDAACLCWDAHGSAVQLLRFPLQDGDRFTADLWAAPGAQVVINATEITGPDGPEPGFRSVASYAEGGTFLSADYSPGRGQFVRVATHFGSPEPFAQLTLVSEASGQEGIAFHAMEMARYRAGAGDPGTLAPVPVTVPNGSDFVLLACFLPGEDGFYGAELSTAGVPLACGGASTSETSYAGTYTEATVGPGSVVATVAGEGFVNIEVFAIDTSAS